MQNLQVKPGDEVIVRRNMQPDELHTVERVTPTGRIIVKVSNRTTWEFNPDGYLRGSTDQYSRPRLIPTTPELRAEVYKATLIRNICAMRGEQWAQLSIETLETIAGLAGLARSRG